MHPFPNSLFWDCDPESVDPEKHCRFIIGRVLARGTMEDWNHLKQLYGHQRLREEVVKLRSLSYFDDAEDEPDPIILGGQTWQGVKETIDAAVRSSA